MPRLYARGCERLCILEQKGFFDSPAIAGSLRMTMVDIRIVVDQRTRARGRARLHDQRPRRIPETRRAALLRADSRGKGQGDAASDQARHLWRAWWRPGLDPVLRRGRPRLCILLALPRADREARRRAGGRAGREGQGKARRLSRPRTLRFCMEIHANVRVMIPILDIVPREVYASEFLGARNRCCRLRTLLSDRF